MKVASKSIQHCVELLEVVSHYMRDVEDVAEMKEEREVVLRAQELLEGALQRLYEKLDNQ